MHFPRVAHPGGCRKGGMQFTMTPAVTHDLPIITHVIYPCDSRDLPVSKFMCVSNGGGKCKEICGIPQQCLFHIATKHLTLCISQPFFIHVKTHVMHSVFMNAIVNLFGHFDSYIPFCLPNIICIQPHVQ